MARTLRFHLDENGDSRIAAGLRLHGIDVTTTPESAMRGKSDEEQLAFALAECRVIITRDTDFLRIAASGQEHPGVVFYPSAGRSIGQIIDAVHMLWEMDGPEQMRNHVEYI
jgi:uncharacterized protein with PIN domain